MIHPTYTTLLRLIDQDFSQGKALRIVDYGCGSGYFLEVIGKKRINEYYGYDVNEESIRRAKKSYQNNNVHFFYMQKDTFPHLSKRKNIDVLILIGVLQYMNNKEFNALLKEAKTFLSPNGVLIISCSVDHVVYRVINVLQIFSPHRLIQRKHTIHVLERSGFRILNQFERGMLLSPVFSQIAGVFDLFDRMLFPTKGTLGPIGKAARGVMNICSSLEYLLPINYGYTLFIVAKKISEGKQHE